jgi:hypothetical protein
MTSCLTVLFVTSGLDTCKAGLDKCKAVHFSSAKFVSWGNRLLVVLHNDAFSTANNSGCQLEKELLKRWVGKDLESGNKAQYFPG